MQTDKATHTPAIRAEMAPTGARIYDNAENLVACVYASGKLKVPQSISVPEAHANARLFSAAPDLLDALYSALNLESVAKAGENHPAWKGLNVDWHFAKIRAAILKAEGKD